MNHNTRVKRGPWRPTARTTAAIFATVALALPAAVYASSPGGHTVQLSSTATQSALAFSRCMRSHGVPNYPDPTSAGVIPKETPQQLGVSGSQFQTAHNACQHLLPNGGQPTPAALRQSWSDFLKFAQCMRRHGVSSWPDPGRYPPHPERPYFDLQRAGIDPNSPQISTEIHACLPLLHGNNPQRLGAGSTLSRSTNLQKALAYSRCMRSHGVPKFPDPSSSGAFPKVSAQQVGVSSSQLQAAQNRCRYLLPNGGSGVSQTQVQQWMSGMLKFAHCMRSHGVSSWPDPVIDAGGNPEFYLDGKIDQNSPQVKSKIQGCLHWLPSFAISPGNPVACPGPNPGPNPGPGCGGCGCRRAPGR